MDGRDRVQGTGELPGGQQDNLYSRGTVPGRKKEVLGLWLGKTENAAFWMGVLTDLKARGVVDILITATDNLNGFTDTIRNVFPESRTQICVVHQIRNACRYVVWKDKKEFTADMKLIYDAPTREAPEAALDDFAAKWEGHVWIRHQVMA